MAKVAFNKQKTFYQQTELKCKEKTSKMLHLEQICMVLKLVTLLKIVP